MIGVMVVIIVVVIVIRTVPAIPAVISVAPVGTPIAVIPEWVVAPGPAPAPVGSVDVVAPIVGAVPTPVDAGAPEQRVVGVPVEVGVIVVVVIQRHIAVEAVDAGGVLVVVVGTVVFAFDGFFAVGIVFSLHFYGQVVAFRRYGIVATIGGHLCGLFANAGIGVVVFRGSGVLSRCGCNSQNENKRFYNTDFKTLHFVPIFILCSLCCLFPII